MKLVLVAEFEDNWDLLRERERDKEMNNSVD